MAVSKIALAQALHVVEPSIKREKLLRLIEVPWMVRNGHIDARYFYQSDATRVKPWSHRSPKERDAALQAARELLGGRNNA